MIFRYKIKFISDIEQKIRKLLVNIAVTPFVGVWIEIRHTTPTNPPIASLPSWECGLKFTMQLLKVLMYLVTPFVGVWIEIVNVKTALKDKAMSLPSWECGLK